MCAEKPSAETPPQQTIANKFTPTDGGSGVRALRRWRASIPNRTYFITACTAGRQPLFASDEIAALIFSHLHSLETDRQEIEIIASVVMPDHVHAVFALGDTVTLDAAMKHFRGPVAVAANRALTRTGSVWQRGYFDRLLRIDDRLETILHYLWHNPTPAGRHFRCRHETWEWFRTCVHDNPDYYDWLKLNP